MLENQWGLYCIDEEPTMPETHESSFPAHVSLAMMYIPYQNFENTYEPEKALSQGTLFADLYMPFYGSKRRNS